MDKATFIAFIELSKFVKKPFICWLCFSIGIVSVSIFMPENKQANLGYQNFETRRSASKIERDIEENRERTAFLLIEIERKSIESKRLDCQIEMLSDEIKFITEEIRKEQRRRTTISFIRKKK